jgi:hypothetical protein
MHTEERCRLGNAHQGGPILIAIASRLCHSALPFHWNFW